MSGLLALLDDVAAIARLASAQIDDIAGQAAKVGAKVGPTLIDDATKAGAKAAGVVIDDAAVTPKYVTGLPAARELPIIWKIARASFFNKLVILLPIAILLNTFLPWLITPLLMIGGCYLCFEGAEKVLHWIRPHAESHAQEAETLDAAHLEEKRVKGAIKTDFILSAEITAIALSSFESDSWINTGLVLAVVAIFITSLVYGAVALLVKMDDVGLKLAEIGRTRLVKGFGRGLVAAMPWVLRVVGFVGTLAMLWVGGNIIVHGVDVLGWHWPYETIKVVANSAAYAIGVADGFVKWFVTAFLDGIIGLVLGFLLIPVVTKGIAPFVTSLFPEKQAGNAPVH
jgi:predicted DNA repair protein MutK